MCVRLSRDGSEVSVRRVAMIVAAIVAVWIGLVITSMPAQAQDGPCAARLFDNARFTVCTIDPATHDIVLYTTDAQGRAYAGFARLPQERDGAPLVFAMNAGMYHADLSPVGLHVEEGEQIKAINTRPGPGNFHMLPNGVFYMAGDTAGVATAENFLARGIAPDLATQSGPMLVIDDSLHPRFIAGSTSLRRRNGVCVGDDGAIRFAISEQPVNFHHFARLFRDGLGCRDALYLDGSMSSLHAPALGRSDAIRPMGPIIAAYPRRP
ncbi:MAG: phosphodiester glycosidase family protein [Salinarimonas sp.]